MVAAKNRTNALDNPRAAYPAALAAEDVDGLDAGRRGRCASSRSRGGPTAASSSCSPPRTACASSPRRPIWVLGAGWSSGSPTAGEPRVGRGRLRDDRRGLGLPAGRDLRPAGGDRPRGGRRRVRVPGAAARRGARARVGERPRRDARGRRARPRRRPARRTSPAARSAKGTCSRRTASSGCSSASSSSAARPASVRSTRRTSPSRSPPRAVPTPRPPSPCSRTTRGPADERSGPSITCGSG